MASTMDETLDKTTLTTISLLEARLLRIEHILFGSSAPSAPSADSAIDSLEKLEQRFTNLLKRLRVYADLVKIYKAHPSLFQPTPPADPPTALSIDALRSTVLSFATAFPSTASALTAVTADTPVPDASVSASLAELLPQMRALEVLQRAQEAEIAELRARSEVALRTWYEGRVLRYGSWVADVEGRVEAVERGVRRAERRAEVERSTA